MFQHTDKEVSKDQDKGAPSRKCAASDVIKDKGKGLAKYNAPKWQIRNAPSSARVSFEPTPSADPTLPVVSRMMYNDASASSALFQSYLSRRLSSSSGCPGQEQGLR